jgi:hypothetical protein
VGLFGPKDTLFSQKPLESSRFQYSIMFTTYFPSLFSFKYVVKKNVQHTTGIFVTFFRIPFLRLGEKFLVTERRIKLKYYLFTLYYVHTQIYQQRFKTDP